MLISSQQLIGLPVETQSGEDLGVVKEVDIDIDSQSILNYHIRPGGLVSGLLKSEDLIIGRGLVLSITEKKIIVDDGAARESEEVEQTEELTNKKTATAVNMETSEE